MPFEFDFKLRPNLMRKKRCEIPAACPLNKHQGDIAEWCNVVRV